MAANGKANGKRCAFQAHPTNIKTERDGQQDTARVERHPAQRRQLHRPDEAPYI